MLQKVPQPVKADQVIQQVVTVNQVQGRMEDFVIERGPRDIAYSGNMGAIAPISTANGALF